MSEPIKAGDLVQVIKPRLCGCDDTVGQIFVAGPIGRSSSRGYCLICHRNTYGAGAWRTETPWGSFTELGRLKRIPPLDELDDEKDASGLDEKNGNRILTPKEFAACMRDVQKALSK